MRTLFATAVLFTALGLTPGMAQVPVIDNANLAKAQRSCPQSGWNSLGAFSG